MPGMSTDWAAGDRAAPDWGALSSEHERLVRTARDQDGKPGADAAARWAERAGAGSPDASAAQATSGLRLVVRAA